MPLYEWSCNCCGVEREVLQRYDDPPPICETCLYEMKKKISVSSFSLKGGGWASDNYGLKSD